MSHTPPSNPRTGISITGLLLGAIVEQSYDKKYTNYRLGVATESRPDKFNQIVQTTNEIELTEQQYQRLQHSVASNVNTPVRIWVELEHRAGEKNGKVWDILTLRFRGDSEIEFLSSNPTSQSDSPMPLGVKSSRTTS